MADDQKFPDDVSLNSWLLDRGVTDTEAEAAGDILLRAGVKHAGELIGLNKVELKELGFSVLLANSVSKKLAQPQVKRGSVSSLRRALAEFKAQPTPARFKVDTTQRFNQQVASVYESNCTDLLVKSLYNAGATISSNYRVRSNHERMDEQKYLSLIKKKQLTPDFFAINVLLPSNLKWGAQICATNKSQAPCTVANMNDLDTPPSSPTLEPKSKLVAVVFEYSVDPSKVFKKMQQLENYVAYLNAAGIAIGLAGLAFPSDVFHKVVQNLTGSTQQFPILSQLHEKGLVVVMACDATFVKDAVSVASSQSVASKKMAALLEALVNFQLDG